MSILLIIQHLQIGGAQTFLIRLANALAKKGYQVYLWDIEKSRQNPAIVKNIHPAVQVVGEAYKPSIFTRLFCNALGSVSYKLGWNRYQKHRLYDFFHRRFFRSQLRKFIHTHPVEVINSHMAKADYFVSTVASQTSVPWIISTHGCYDRFGEVQASSVTLEIAARYLPESSYIIMVADKNAAALQKLSIPPTHYTKLWCGFDANIDESASVSFQRKSGSFYFGIVSRAMPEKGWEEAILATQTLVEKGYAAELILVGDGLFADSLRQKYTQPFIHFAGATSTPIGWIQQFDIGLLPSRFAGESCPNSIIEYLFCQKPVITIDIGEIKDMLLYHNEYAGFVLPLKEGTIPQGELTKCMEKYLTNRELLEQHRSLARNAFQKFDMNLYLEKYVSIIKKVSNK